MMKHCHRGVFVLAVILYLLLIDLQTLNAQITPAERTGFTWITTQEVQDSSYGAGFSVYSAVYPILEKYPGPNNIQVGLASQWVTTQRTGNEPGDFYTTIEGGLGWWHDTRFATETPKFIMGGVAFNFSAWANGVGAGSTAMLADGHRDWSEPGGKYGVAQLSPNLLWPPDGLNIKQGTNGELLGYGYMPLPLTEPMDETAGTDVATGNQCWTLFLNTIHFKGPATFFLPTFWSKPSLEDPSLEGLFLDARPSDQNVGFGMEHATTPALISYDYYEIPYARIAPLLFPKSSTDKSVLVNQIKVYSRDALWNDLEDWFNGDSAVQPGINPEGEFNVIFTSDNNGGAIAGEISTADQNYWEYPIDIGMYIQTFVENNTIMGYELNPDYVKKVNENFVLPEYFRFEQDHKWRPIEETEVPQITGLLENEVIIEPRNDTVAYLTPLEADCPWQDPNGPWNMPGPSAGPFQVELGDGSTITYYWYYFINQPAIIQANLPDTLRQILQERAEMIHTHWNHDAEYLVPPTTGTLASLDPALIVQPPAGMEVGYVPIISRQEKTPPKVRVFILAGQSNMQGQGAITDAENDPGTLIDVIEHDVEGNWAEIGEIDNWNILENVWLHFARSEDTIRSQVTVGQGANSELIGPELMFAYEIDEMYFDPVLLIKTAWGGVSLAVDFRPPSAGGETGEYYTRMIETVQQVTSNIATEFPEIGAIDFEITGFCWFQGWNDGASIDYLNEYENNLTHLINDVRNDLNVPELPYVIANSGQGGYELSDDLWTRDIQTMVVPAQENVACNPDYSGKVGYVDTRPFYFELEVSPTDAIHHFHNNALTFLNVGRKLGIEMKEAIDDTAFCNKIAQIISFELPSELGLSVGSFILEGQATSGLHVVYSSSGESIITIVDSTAIILSTGTVSITAMQPGNHEYQPAEPVKQVITIYDDMVGIFEESQAFIVYPNPTSNLISIENKVGIINKIQLVDITGKIINTWEKVNKPKFEIEISAKKGFYFLKVSTIKGNQSIHRIIKVD